MSVPFAISAMLIVLVAEPSINVWSELQ